LREEKNFEVYVIQLYVYVFLFTFTHENCQR